MQIELTEKLWAGKWGGPGPSPTDDAMKMTIIKFNVHTDACACGAGPRTVSVCV